MRPGMVVLSEHREPIEDSGPAGKDLAHDYPTFATYAKACTIHTYESCASNSFRIHTYETLRNRINLRHFNPCRFCTYAAFCFNSFTINTYKKHRGEGDAPVRAPTTGRPISSRRNFGILHRVRALEHLILRGGGVMATAMTATARISDELLIRKGLRGDEGTLETLFTQHKRTLYQTALRFLANPEYTEAPLQYALLSVDRT